MRPLALPRTLLLPAIPVTLKSTADPDVPASPTPPPN
jgi:hypothetical protein